MGSKGGGTTVMLPQAQAQTTTVAPNPVALAGYANVVGQAQNLQAENRGFTPDQQQAFNQVQQLQGVADPWINQAGEFAQQGLGAGNALINSGANAGSPTNFGQNINAYMSPYMDDVVKATMANINETNAQQQSQLTGNAIAQGALGGNRVGVAGSELARQQNLTNNATLAQILQQGYGQAGQNLFQNAGLQMQAGNALGSLGNQTAGIYSGLGNEALSTGLQGANALLQTGGMQQALPYQQLGWLSNIINNTGPNMGQTGAQSSMGFTSQYAPQPNLLNSIIGGGVAAAGAFLPKARGGAVLKAHGGGLGEYDPRSDDYDSPVGGGFGAIPEVRPTNAHGLQLPAFLAMQQAHQGQQQQDKSPSFADDLKAGQGLRGLYDRYGTGGGGGEDFGGGGNEVGGDILSEARGGRVRGYDDGGEVIDDTATSPDPFSDEGGLRAPRSVRNNNPGNIEDGPFARGLPGYKGGDGRFAVFDSPDSGVGAQDRLLESYGKRGFNTPAAIVGRWAPAAENGGDSTNRYVSHVSQKLGVDPNTPLDMSDPNVRAGVRSAMAEYEAGTNGQTRALAYASPGDGGGGLGAINSAAPISEGRSADTGVAPPDAEPGFLEKLGVPKISPDTRAALISAGLGMMASKSHWLGPAIGEGGLAGVKAYYENQQNARQNAIAQSGIGYRAGELALKNRQQDIIEQRIRALTDAASFAQRGIYGGVPSIAAGTPGGTAPTGAGGQMPAAPSSSTPGTNAQGVPQLAPFSDPVFLDKRATMFEQAAARAAIDPNGARDFITQAQQARQAAAQIRSSGKAVTVDGRIVPLPGALETATAEEAAKKPASTSSGEEYFGGDQGSAQPTQNAPANPASEQPQKALIDPRSAEVKTAIPPAPRGGGFPTPDIPAGAKLTKIGDPAKELAKNDADFSKDVIPRAPTIDTAIARYRSLAQAFKKFESGSTKDQQYTAAAFASAIGQEGIANTIMAGGKDAVAGIEWVRKEGINVVLDTLKAATPRFAQSEFNKLSEQGVPNPTSRPEANHQLVAEGLGQLMHHKQFIEDWGQAQQQGWKSISSFYTQWSKANPMSAFIAGAQRQIGNFKGMDVPPRDKWVENGIYTAPTTMTPAQKEAYGKRGVQEGQMFRYTGQSITPIKRDESFSSYLQGQ